MGNIISKYSNLFLDKVSSIEKSFYKKYFYYTENVSPYPFKFSID